MGVTLYPWWMGIQYLIRWIIRSDLRGSGGIDGCFLAKPSHAFFFSFLCFTWDGRERESERLKEREGKKEERQGGGERATFCVPLFLSLVFLMFSFFSSCLCFDFASSCKFIPFFLFLFFYPCSLGGGFLCIWHAWANKAPMAGWLATGQGEQERLVRFGREGGRGSGVQRYASDSGSARNDSIT